MDGLINALVIAGLCALGFFIGGARERAHLRNLDRRENEVRHLLVSNLKSLPGLMLGPRPPRLVVGEVVIATDYLKTFVASLQQLVGGELRTYRSLMMRARREAVLRLAEQAKAEGYNAIGCLRVDAADIGGTTGSRRGVPMVGVLATGTAYYRHRSSP